MDVDELSCKHTPTCCLLLVPLSKQGASQDAPPPLPSVCSPVECTHCSHGYISTSLPHSLTPYTQHLTPNKHTLSTHAHSQTPHTPNTLPPTHPTHPTHVLLQGSVPPHIRAAAQRSQEGADLRAANEEAVAPGKPADANLLAAYMAYIAVRVGVVVVCCVFNLRR